MPEEQQATWYLDAATAYGFNAVRNGAVLSGAGGSELANGGFPSDDWRNRGLGRVVQRARSAETDEWVVPEVPVLVRGDGPGRVPVIPLGWSGDPRSPHSLPRATPRRLEVDMMMSMKFFCAHWMGYGHVLDLDDVRRDSVGSYTAALRQAGATRVWCFSWNDTLGVTLVQVGSEQTGHVSLALHVVPRSWIIEPDERGLRAWQPVPGINVRWSWAEVSALYARTAGA